MKAEYINPFVTATTETLNQFIPDIEIERGEISLSEGPHETVGTVTLIGISGDLEGRVLYELDRHTAVNIASAMNGEDFPGLNNMARSTIQELSNIISGNASQEMSKLHDHKDIKISPPSMIVGDDQEISDTVSSKYLYVPLNTNLGEIGINLAVRES